MTRLQNTGFLFIIIALEGFIILSTELLAMRLTTPFVGSGTDTISVIIAAVLMPLAFGYHAGGQFKGHTRSGRRITIRRKLMSNVVIASAFLLPGLTYFIFQFFFAGLDASGLEHNIIKISLYCIFFIVYPMYLLGQTVPLVSNYFSKEKLSRITGKMLFTSTIGSFAGSILTTLVLMDKIGVHHTVTILFCMLFCLIVILEKKQHQIKKIIMAVILGICALLNSNQIMDALHIVKNNKYSTMMIEEDEDGARHLLVNNNDSSMYSEDGAKHEYVEFVEKITLDSIPENAAPKDVLIIGAGGFTYGHNDEKNNFVYIDIDKDLKDISERYLLREKLKPNKVFYPLPARAYLAGTDKKFDVIFLDAYIGALTIPEHLVTQEFFIEVKEHLKNNGVLVTNFIVSTNFNNTFSKNIDNTLRSVFPHISRRSLKLDYGVWTYSNTQAINTAYIYKHHQDMEDESIYRDAQKQR